MSNLSLTNLSLAGGCGCKLEPEKLQTILSHFKVKEMKGVKIGFDTSDDCAVYEYSHEDYLLFTTDFFTPLVDDPYVYGSLAAANALSDVFAMGGKPIIANTILGFPPDKLSPEIIQEILRGGANAFEKVDCAIVGGHTIINQQPIYGFSIIGRVDKNNLKPNNGAKDGDILILTKPIGSGVLSNALKLGLLNDECYNHLLPFLLEINTYGYELGKIQSVHAMTDVTGFGLVGHALEMTQNNSCSLEIDSKHVDFFLGTQELCDAVFSPTSGAVKNLKAYSEKVEFLGTWSLEEKFLFCDPQSNGGLLIAVDPNALEAVQSILQASLGRLGKVIGRFSSCVGSKPLRIIK